MINPRIFTGAIYRLASNWLQKVDVVEYHERPIRYLEIGALYGANVISVANSYGIHPESELHCIDPWIKYNEYNEYSNHNDIYEACLENINKSGQSDKIRIHRGFSNEEVPKFLDNYFDIIYIDGNHEPEFVMEDAVLSFRKLKNDGIMIFDDYGWGGEDLTQSGIDGFIKGYHKRITVLGFHNDQMFIKKKQW